MSEKVKRYTEGDVSEWWMTEDEQGGWVKYEDYARAVAQLRRRELKILSLNKMLDCHIRLVNEQEKQLEEIREEAKEAQIVLEVMEAND